MVAEGLPGRAAAPLAQAVSRTAQGGVLGLTEGCRGPGVTSVRPGVRRAGAAAAADLCAGSGAGPGRWSGGGGGGWLEHHGERGSAGTVGSGVRERGGGGREGCGVRPPVLSLREGALCAPPVCRG